MATVQSPGRAGLTYAVLLAAFAAGCGSSDEGASGGSSGDIPFAPVRSLSDPSGKGGFRFGAASAATQIEDGNTSTDWYLWTQPKPDGLGNGTFVGDAVKGYTLALQDIELMKSLHLDSYRFSIEWARIEPKRNQIDEAAIKHYSDFIDALRAANIRPLVTIHHFSNPVWIDDPRDPTCAKGPTDDNLCGFGHPQGGPLVIKELAEHAKLLAERFGDRVDEWGTLNEPINYLVASYGMGVFPPGKKYLFSLLDKFVPVVRDYVAAHAAMYAAIKQADQTDADGDGVAASVGLSQAVADWVPSRFNDISADPEDVAARDRLVYVFHHLLVDSLRAGKFDKDLDGNWDEDQPSWKGTIDWLGLQYYFRGGVTGNNGLIPVIKVTPCFEGFDFGSCVPPTDPSFCVPTMGYEGLATGLYDVLSDFGKRYPDLPLVVTEAGIATAVGERRAENVVRTLEQIQKAKLAGIDVRGYYHWSLSDNFEWAEGFKPHFGLYAVDYTSYARTSTKGADVFSEIAGARKLSKSLRAQYGGEGPMTPEGTPPDGPCKKY